MRYHLALTNKSNGDIEKERDQLVKALNKKDFAEYEEANRLLKDMKKK